MFQNFFNKVSNFGKKVYHTAKTYAPIVNNAINSAKQFVSRHGGNIRHALNRVRQGAAAFSVIPGVGGAIARGVGLGADFLHRGVSKAESLIPVVTRWQENLGMHTGGFSSPRPRANRPRSNAPRPPMSGDVVVTQRALPPPTSYRALQIRA